MTSRSAPTRAERWAVALGALGVPLAVAVWLAAPEAPPLKGAAPTLSLAPVVAFAAGLCLVAGTVRSVAVGWRRRAWPTAPGVVTQVRSVGVPYLFIAGDYAAGGTSYTLRDVRHGLGGRWASVRVGDRVAVRHDPADPSRASFEPAVTPASLGLLAVGAASAALGAVGSLAA